jgi:dihydroorotate dehydrogenase electron transfer subunit
MSQVYESSSRVLEQNALSVEYHLLAMDAPELARCAVPGQFVMFGCGSGYDPFLRRPLSIHQVDRERGEVSFLYQDKGAGTHWLARRRPGDRLEWLGPLGHGCEIGPQVRKSLVVGAGIGVAPLLFLSEELERQGREVTILIGARTADKILCQGKFAACGNLKVNTDDGSTLRQGSVLEGLELELQGSKYDMLFACGPLAVLIGVQELSQKKKMPAQISLEEKMACGVGACLGCACRRANGDGYLRVCRDGPVCIASEVNLHD